MKAMILAAGLGTRLRPVTDSMPKALVRVGGKTLLEHAIGHLSAHGIREVIINVHHFAGQIIRYLEDNNNFGMEMAVSDETGGLLDTGGGVKKAAWFFSDGAPFVVRNVDLLSDLDLDKVARYHEGMKAMATLVTRERETSRYFLFDDKLELAGWKNTRTGEEKITRERHAQLRPLAFSGIQILNPALFDLITEEGRFSLTDLYIRLSALNRIVAFIDKDSLWRDAGKP